MTTYECLLASLHLVPAKIPDAVRTRVRAVRDQYTDYLTKHFECLIWRGYGELTGQLVQFAKTRVSTP